MRGFAASRDVRFLSKHTIEFDALWLLRVYGERHGDVLQPPVPVDKILETFLRLSFSIMDLEAELGAPDIDGALWLDRKEVGVDRKLDPDAHPNMEGRLNFTIAHEIGHWQLHRRYYLPDETDGFPLGPAAINQPALVCRSNDRSRIEWQANYFASSLLMPRAMVREAWRAKYGKSPMQVQTLMPQRAHILASEVLRRGGLPRGDVSQLDVMFEHVGLPLARVFKVSPQAMRIRLEELGFLERQGQATLF